MKFINKLFASAAILGSVVMLPACSDDVNLDNAKAVFVEITPKNMALTVGQTQRLDATVQNQDGQTLDVPVTWSVDDETVAKIYPVYRKVTVDNPDYPGDKPATTPGEGEGEGEGDGDQTAGDGDEATEGEGDATGEGDELDIPEKIQVDTDEILYYQVEAQAGAQDRATLVRATLPNGDYAVASVNVIKRTITDNCLKPYAEGTVSASYMNTSHIYFKLDDMALLDEQPLHAEFKVTEVHPGTWKGEGQPGIKYRGSDDISIINDPDNGDIICVDFVPDEFCGKGVCTLFLGEGEGAQKCSVNFTVLPLRYPGFEIDGQRPGAGAWSPSNLKQTQLYATMDINSDYSCGACIGIETHSSLEIARAMACEDGDKPYFYWEIEGSSVVVTDQWIDTSYTGGYVSYCSVRSGSREGVSILRYVMPDTVMTCNLQVENFNVSHPVEDIVVKKGDDPCPDHLDLKIGTTTSLEVYVTPESSFDYHMPVVESLDPSIVKVQDRMTTDGYTRTLVPVAEGTTRIHITSLDKERYIEVSVADDVNSFYWAGGNPSQFIVGDVTDIKVQVTMKSGKPLSSPVEFTSSDPSVVSVANKPGDFSAAVVTAVGEGTATITASYYDRTLTYDVTVEAIKDIVQTGLVTIEYYGDGDFYMGGDDWYFDQIPFDVYGAWTGNYHFTGTANVQVGQSIFEDAQYDLTFTFNEIIDEDEGIYGYTVSGVINLPNGAKIILNDVEVEYYNYE